MPNRFWHSLQPKPNTDAPRATVGDRLEQFERGQRKLWRLTYGLLSLLTVAFAAASWDTLRSLAQRYELLLVGVVVVVALIMVYAWKRNQEIAELRGLVRGIEQSHTSAPSDQQLDKLFSVIERCIHIAAMSLLTQVAFRSRSTPFRYGILSSRAFHVTSTKAALSESDHSKHDGERKKVIDEHKDDQLQKQKEGKGHWKKELSSNSESAIKADREEIANAGSDIANLQKETSSAMEADHEHAKAK